MAYLLGIDIGTSGTKTVLFDVKGSNNDDTGISLISLKTDGPEQDPRTGGKLHTHQPAMLAKSGVNPGKSRV